MVIKNGLNIYGFNFSDRQKSVIAKLREKQGVASRLSEDLKKLDEHLIQMKVAAVMNRFQAGKKLSSGDLAILRRHNPTAYSDAVRVMREREFLERQMRNAPTKQEINNIRMTTLATLGNRSEIANNPELKLARANQLANAYYEYAKTEHYRKKPDGGLRRRNRRDRYEKS
jgi:hypothetical protein